MFATRKPDVEASITWTRITGALVVAGLAAAWTFGAPALHAAPIGPDVDVTAPGFVPEQAIGRDDSEPVFNYRERDIYRRLGRAVGVLWTTTNRGEVPCSAFIVSSEYIVTNHHCLPGLKDNPRTGVTDVRSARFVTGYLQDGREEETASFPVDVTPVESDKALDYAVLRVEGDPAAAWGTLRLSGEPIEERMGLWIVGHPRGGAQRISRQGCRTAIPVAPDDPPQWKGMVRHVCDTRGGSSGSPVFDVNERAVVALHRGAINPKEGPEKGKVRNIATPMSAILKHSRVLRGLAEPDGYQAAGSKARDRVAVVAPTPGTGADGSERNRGERLAALSACDRIVAVPLDTQHPRGAIGVPFKRVESARAAAICRKALALAPDDRATIFQLGRALKAAGNYAEALVLYGRAAQRGYAVAQNNLGVMYDLGQGVETDDETAVAWYRSAARQGDPTAQYNLGVMYELGEGVAKDPAQAAFWYARSAAQGYANAQYNMGLMLANGRGVERDDAAAVAWYRQAADQGNSQAQNNLGWMYESGRGVPRDRDRAVSWYRKAAARGHERAAENVRRLTGN